MTSRPSVAYLVAACCSLLAAWPGSRGVSASLLVGIAEAQEIRTAADASASEHKLAEMTSTLPVEARTAFASLQAIAETLSERDGDALAVGSIGGTAHPSEVLAGERQAKRTFIADVQRFTASRAPVATVQAARQADAALNKEYAAAMRRVALCDVCDANKTEGRDTLRDAQRTWLTYRDAWMAFYAARWAAAASAEALRQEVAMALSKGRITFLRKLSSEY